MMKQTRKLLAAGLVGLALTRPAAAQTVRARHLERLSFKVPGARLSQTWSPHVSSSSVSSTTKEFLRSISCSSVTYDGWRIQMP